MKLIKLVFYLKKEEECDWTLPFWPLQLIFKLVSAHIGSILDIFCDELNWFVNLKKPVLFKVLYHLLLDRIISFYNLRIWRWKTYLSIWVSVFISLIISSFPSFYFWFALNLLYFWASLAIFEQLLILFYTLLLVIAIFCENVHTTLSWVTQ
jgi:hypothetical protein